MDYCALRRKSRVLRPRTALKEEQIMHFLLITCIIQRRSLECKQFSASGIFYFLTQDYRIFRKEKIKGKTLRHFGNISACLAQGKSKKVGMLSADFISQCRI